MYIILIFEKFIQSTNAQQQAFLKSGFGDLLTGKKKHIGMTPMLYQMSAWMK